METENRTTDSGAGKDRVKRRKFYVFLLCLIISVFLWLVIKLSKVYVADEVYPVIFYNMPSGMTMTSPVNSKLVLTRKISGYYAFLNKYFQPEQTLFIDLKNLNLKKTDSCYEATMYTSELMEKISGQLNRYEKLVSISPYSLLFRFVPVSSKKVPVRIKLNVQYDKQYNIYRRAYPDCDSLIISGPAEQIGPVSEVVAESPVIKGVRESFFKTLYPISTAGASNISFNPDHLHVFVPVVQYTEASMMVPVLPDSFPGKYTIKTYPEKVKVTYTIAVADYKKVDASMFSAVVSTKALLNGEYRKIRVDLKRYPKMARIMNTEPEYVEYIVLK